LPQLLRFEGITFFSMQNLSKDAVVNGTSLIALSPLVYLNCQIGATCSNVMSHFQVDIHILYILCTCFRSHSRGYLNYYYRGRGPY
jgi:hypothetical protein